MGIFLVIVVVLAFLFFAARARMSSKVINFSGFVVVLLVFEFLETVLEPTISHYTHGSPIYYTMANILLASSIKPLHEFLEHHLVHHSNRIKEKRHQKLMHKQHHANKHHEQNNQHPHNH